MTTECIVNKCNLANVSLTKSSIDSSVESLLRRCTVSDPLVKSAVLLKAITLIDLTTLSGDDTDSNVKRLCNKARNALDEEIVDKLGFKIETAAVCVYPSRIRTVAKFFNTIPDCSIDIAAVATGFPTGLYPLKTRLQEIVYCIEEGATEVDIVIDRSFVLCGMWDELFEELCQMRKVCTVKLKVILGVGELGSYTNIYKASMLAMHAGADFIKTSTGKENVNATLPIGLVMCRAIKAYYQETERKVGLKPAGGLKTPQDAINWIILVKEILGVEWLDKSLFRIGASSLLGGIEKNLYEHFVGEADAKRNFNFI